MAEKEAELRLRVTSQNEASPAFKAVEDVMLGLQKVTTEVTASIQKSLSAISESSSGMAGSFSSNVNEDISSINNLSKSMEENSNLIDRSLRSMEEVMNVVALGIEKQTQVIETSFSAMESTIARSSSETEKSAQGMVRAITDVGLLVGLQQIGQSMEHLGEQGKNLFVGAITAASDFEGNISRIHAVLMHREPTANLKEMSDTALKLGSNSKFSANEIAQGMYDLARQGLSSSQILGDGVTGAIETVNNLAQSVDGNMGETAKVVTDILHEFNLQGKDLAHVGDEISGAMHTSSISMNDFYYAMRQIGPVASNMHQSVDDVSTSIALLAQHGITGSIAGTAMKNMLLGLEPRTKKAAELMHELGISAKDGASESFYQLNGNLKAMPDIIEILNNKFGDLNDRQKQAALSATFTKYGLAGLNVIVGEGKQKFDELKKTLGDEKSADIAREKLNNLQGDMLRLHAATQTMSKSFGDTLQPAMRSVAQAAEDVVHWFTALSPQTKEVIMVGLGLVSAIAIIGGAIVTFVSTLGFLNMGLAGINLALAEFDLSIAAIAAPVAIAVVAFAAIGFAIFELWKHFDTVSAWIKQNFGVDLPAVFNSIKTVTVEVFNSIGEVFKTVWTAVKQVTQDVWNYIEPTIMGAVKKISDFWNQVFPQLQQVFKVVWEGIKVILIPILVVMQLGITTTLGFIKGAWHDAWNAIKTLFKTVWDLIVDSLRLSFDIITGIFKIALDLLTGHWGKAWDDMKSLVKNIFGDIGKLFGDFTNNALNFGKDLVMGIAHGIEGAIGSVISAAKKVVDAISSIFSSAPKSPNVSSGSGNAVKAASSAAPKFGDGGVITKPTLAWVGEAGEDEYIIPKSKLTEQDGYTMGLNGVMNMGGKSSGNGGGNVFHITVNGVGKDGKQIGSDIAIGIKQNMSFVF